MKDIILPFTCKQFGIGLMILPLPLLLLGVFINNGILITVGGFGLIADIFILFVLLLVAWEHGDLPRFPIKCKCK